MQHEFEQDPFEVTTLEDTIDDTIGLSKDYSYFDFEGIAVPYRPSAQVTVLQADGSTSIRDIPPAFIINLRTFLETGSRDALHNAMLSITKEALLSLVRSSAFKKVGWEAPIAVSNSVPEGMIWPDYKGGRIVINEWQATRGYMDADGDRALALFNDDKTKAVLVKYPITSQPLILTVSEVPPMENYYNFGKKEAKKTIKDYPVKQFGVNVDLQALFYQKHMEVQVGLLTNAWNSFDLWESSKMDWAEKNEYIYNSYLDDETGKTQRALDIEDGGMKAARKDDKLFVDAKVLEFGAGQALAHEHAWALTSCSSIGKMRDNQLEWCINANLDDVMTDIMKLKVRFRKVRPTANPEIPDPYIEGNLLSRLKELGLIQWQELPHVDPNMPPSIIFWLSLPSGEPVALTDVKREGRSEGLTYMFMLSPVWDNLTLYDAMGNVVVEASKQWVHPINHMQKVCCTFDSIIRPWSNGPISHYFPLTRDLSDWQNPKRSIKVAMLYKFLMEYCGRYGDPCPATRDAQGNITPSNLSTSVIRRSVVIDYGQPSTHEEMWKVACEAHEYCNFCMSTKGTSRRVRKYMLANSVGGSILDTTLTASPHRGAMGRSQLQRALKPVDMTVAIVRMDTLNQIQITQSGILKQTTDVAFLPQVFNTEADYQTHLDAHNLLEAECPATVVRYKTWQGEERLCWTIGARNTIRIGKLVDEIGNKFMPREHAQVYSIDYLTMETEDVDLIFPINELVDKDAHHVFLKNAVERDLVLPDGKTVKCMLVRRRFYRTGAASENVPPRWRKSAFKGIDSFPIYWRYSKIDPNVKPRSWDSGYAKELQYVKNRILAKTGAVSPEIDEWLNS